MRPSVVPQTMGVASYSGAKYACRRNHRILECLLRSQMLPGISPYRSLQLSSDWFSGQRQSGEEWVVVQARDWSSAPSQAQSRSKVHPHSPVFISRSNKTGRSEIPSVRVNVPPGDCCGSDTLEIRQSDLPRPSSAIDVYSGRNCAGPRLFVGDQIVAKKAT